MANKPAPVTDAERRLVALAQKLVAMRDPETAEAIASVLADRARYQEVLRLWNDHLPGCSGSPRCECGYAEAQALLEVQDERA